MRTSNQKASLIVSLFLGIFLLFSPLLFGAVYYVDFTTGDDGDTGLTEELAWKTWDYVRAQSFNAGDTIKFKCGETWEVSGNDRWLIVDSGTSENYITIQSYDTGAKPIFDCTAEYVGKTWADEGDDIWSTALTVNAYRVQLDGVDSGMASTSGGIDGTTYLWHWNGTDNKVYVYSTQNPNSEYTNITVYQANRYIFRPSGCSYIRIKDVRLYSGQYAVSFDDDTTESYIEFDNVDFWYGYKLFNVMKTTGTANNCTIKNCDFDSKLNMISLVIDSGEEPHYDTVTLQQNCDDWHVHNNTFTSGHHSHVTLKVTGSPSQGVRNNIFEHNVFDGTGSAYIRAFGFVGGDLNTGNIIRYNIEKNTNIRTQICGYRNEYYYNLVYEKPMSPATNHTDDSEGVALAISNGGTCHENLIYNNVIYDTYNESFIVGVDAADNIIKNNIFMKVGAAGDHPNICIYANGAGANNVIENNCCYDATTADTIDWEGTIQTVAEADNDESEFSNNISLDPLFIDVPNADFHLHADSPCIEKGVDVGLTRDYEGNDVPYDSFPEIGPYEFLGPILPPPSGLIPTIIPVIIPIIR